MIIEENSSKVKEKAEEIASEINLSLLREGRPIFLNISGRCMYPFLKGGDIAKVTPVKEEDVRIGDIIVVTCGGKDFLGHRLVKVFTQGGKRCYVTKPDTSIIDCDEPVGFERIAGKVTEVKRNGLKVDFEGPPWNCLNRYIAKVSLRCPGMVPAFSRWISLLIEWRWFFSKLGRRIYKPLSSTEELILICARIDINKSLIKKARELVIKGIDWEFFKNTAIKSGLSFLFCVSLKKIDYLALVPSGVINSLKASYLKTLPQISLQYKEATSLLKIFSENDIPVIPLKGFFLSRRLYGDIATRGLSADFDLLVEEKNLDVAKKVLGEAGYLFIKEDNGMEWARQPVFRKPGGIALELHWDIRPEVPSEERMSGLWKGTRVKSEDGVSYYDFNAEELLIFLSAHFIGSKHLGQLRYVCDVNELIRKYGDILDWQAVVKKSREWKLSGSTYATLLLSRSLFKSYIPQEALSALRPGIFKRTLICIAVSRSTILRSDSFGRRFAENFLKYILLQALEVSSIKDFKNLLFPPTEIMGGKSYWKRLKGGILKLINVLRIKER